MKRVPNWLMWIGQGKEISDSSLGSYPIVADEYYLLDSDGSDGFVRKDIIAGPFKSESCALAEVSAITDTSGT